jgi:hypothetical protein
VKYRRVWLEQRDVSYVLATRCNDDMLTADARTGRVDELIAGVGAAHLSPGFRPALSCTVAAPRQILHELYGGGHARGVHQ